MPVGKEKPSLTEWAWAASIPWPQKNASMREGKRMGQGHSWKQRFRAPKPVPGNLGSKVEARILLGQSRADQGLRKITQS